MHLIRLLLLISAKAFGLGMEDTEAAISRNCWSKVQHDEDGWRRIINFDERTSSLALFVNRTRPEVRTCLQNQLQSTYEMTLTRKWGNETAQSEKVIKSVPELLQQNVYLFKYVLLRGHYRIEFRLCDIDTDDLDYGCDNETVVSGLVPVRSSLPGLQSSWCLQDAQAEDQVDYYTPVIGKSSIKFSFAFIPCHKVLPYEQIEVRVYKSATNDSCEKRGLEILSTTVALQSAHVLLGKRHNTSAEAVIAYTTPHLESGHYYCIRLTSKHPFCRSMKPAPFLSDPGVTRQNLPQFCNFTSATVFLTTLPFIAEWVPFCTSHFKCGWLYITIVGTAAFLLAFTLALICNLCCCRRQRSKDSHEPLPVSPSNLDTLKLTDIRPKRTWSDVHEDFYKEPPANPGKILLLYSPDSRAFKELQKAFRSFLELACHCVVLDLFDEELLQSIAYDPETWLDQLLRDDRFKVIVVCSQGAYKRHQAILNGEVLNIPNSETLDGLFSAGLRFLQARQYDSGRLSLARYEMLHLCSNDFSFDDLGADREFKVPSQLHELFCWIHDYDPLDLLGKPWIRYNLELQLLQDALKMARLDRK